MKKLLMAAAMICAAMPVYASNTTYTATVSDTDGQVWINGTWTASLVLPSGPFGNVKPTVGGVVVPSYAKGVIDANGLMTVTVTNPQSLDQTGGVWQITACPNTSIGQFSDTGCVTVPVKDTGGDLTSRFTGLKAPRFPAGINAYGYSDVEVVTPTTPGTTYYNTSNDISVKGMRVWDGTAWRGVGASGSGALPAGSTYELNAKLNNSTFQGSNLFTSSDRSYLYTPAPQFGQYSLNSPKNGYCGRQCGNIVQYSQDQPLLNGSNVGTGYGQSYFQYRKGLFTTKSGFNGYGSYGSYDPAGGSVIKMQEDDVAFHSDAIAQDFSATVHAGKPADTALFYGYIYCHGGYRWGGDEGCTALRMNGGLDYTAQGGFQVSGSPAVGSTAISASQLYSPDDIFVSGFVYDYNASPIASGNITNYDGTNHILTVTAGSVTPATNFGTTTTPITITSSTQDAVNGVSATISVNVTTGTGFTISNASPIVVVCPNPDLEIVVPTAVGTLSGGSQTITANFFHGHPSGCQVAQGGTMGVLDLVADRIGNNWKTSYFVFGAPDTSHIYEVTYLTGNRGNINTWRHNFGPGYDPLNAVSAQITGDGTTITACNLGQGAGNFSGQYVQITGATPTAFNGTYTASTLNKNLCVTMSGTASGTASGATISVGGAINSPDGATQGPGGFKIWATARIKQIGVSSTTDANGITTNAYNNTIYFYPNNFSFINGHNVLVLDDMQSKVEPISAFGRYDVAPNGNLNGWITSQVAGNGVATGAFRLIRAINQNNYSDYKGGGGSGQLDGIRGVSVEGPTAIDFYGDQPVQGGYGVYLERNPNTQNSNLNNSFYPFFVAGAGGGGGGFTINYDPNAGKAIITSGTGNGVYTSITMDPNNFTLGAGTTGTFSFLGQTFKFNQLTSASTTCASLDTTGTLGRVCPTFGASGTTHAVGLVPDPGSTAGTTKFLREDGTWQIPSGTSSGVTTLNGLTGALTIAAGSGISVTPSGSTITIANTGSGGTVTSFSATAPPSLFTTSVANATTTPALTFALSNAGAHNFFGNCSGTAGAPNYCQPSFADISGTATAAQLPIATTAALGGVKPDGTTITVDVNGTIHSSGGSGISGLTAGYLPQATSSTAIGNSFIDYGVTNAGAYTSTKDIYAPAFHSTDTAGTGFGFIGTEGTAPAGVTGADGLWADSTAHRLRMNNNNTGALTVVGISAAATAGHFAVFATGGNDLSDGGPKIANVTVTLPTTAIAANACTVAATVVMTGVATTSAFSTAFASDPSAVVGWGSSGGLSFKAWPTANTLNWEVCNNTAASITPGAMTLNVGAQ